MYYQHKKTGEVIKWSEKHYNAQKNKKDYEYVGFAKHQLTLKKVVKKTRSKK